MREQLDRYVREQLDRYVRGQLDRVHSEGSLTEQITQTSTVLGEVTFSSNRHY